MRPWTALGLAALPVAVGVAARAAAWSAVHRAEDLDPEAIKRPGGLCVVDGAGIHLIDRGSGPALLMVHGFGAATHSFRAQIGPLSAAHRVLALDLPGFGYTEQSRAGQADYSLTGYATLLARLLDRLAVPRVTIMGHSMGGGIALRFAAMYPERVDRLILVAAATPDSRQPLLPQPVLRAILPFVAAALHRNPGRLRRALERIVYDPVFVTDAVWQMYRRPWRMRGYTEGLLMLSRDSRRDQSFPLSSITARSLVLWGEADEVQPLSVAHRLHAELPNARLEVIPRAGHLVLEEQPERATAVIQAFLAEAPRTRGTGAR